MRFFDIPISIQTEPGILAKVTKFTDLVIGTVDYSDSNQSNKIKVWQDHFISKIGEEAVCNVLKQFTNDFVPPDYNIYLKNKKSWDADLKINGVDLAVKTQSKSSSQKYGLSWTFQCGSSRRDKILDEPDSWVSFVHCDDTNNLYNCIVYPSRMIKELVFGEPKLARLRGEKLVIYAKENGFEDLIK